MTTPALTFLVLFVLPAFVADEPEFSVRFDIQSRDQSRVVDLVDLEGELSRRDINVSFFAGHHRYIRGSKDELQKAKAAIIELFGEESLKLWKEAATLAAEEKKKKLDWERFKKQHDLKERSELLKAE